MELNTEEERMIGELHHFRQIFRRRTSRNHHAIVLKLRNISVVDFVTMTMTFANRVAVDLMSQRAGLDGNCLAAQT